MHRSLEDSHVMTSELTVIVAQFSTDISTEGSILRKISTNQVLKLQMHKMDKLVEQNGNNFILTF